MGNPWSWRLLSLLSLVAVGGCTSLEKGAQEEFTSSFSCPKERVTVTPRPDLKAAVFGSRPAPPADVAADPARLAVWQKKEDDLQSTWNNSTTVFEVAGCDKDVIYKCGQAAKHASTSSGIMCTEARHVSASGATEPAGNGSPSGGSGGRTPKHSR